MRAGIYRLATVVEAELGCRLDDGALWCFVSRDRLKAKMLRYDSDAWCLWRVRLTRGRDSLARDASGVPTPAFNYCESMSADQRVVHGGGFPLIIGRWVEL